MLKLIAYIKDTFQILVIYLYKHLFENFIGLIFLFILLAHVWDIVEILLKKLDEWAPVEDKEHLSLL